MKQKIHDAIMGFVVGDAIGVPYEFKTRGLFNCTDMRASTDADFHFALPLGTWSDDTSLMLCVLDALSHFGTQNANQKMFEVFRNNAVAWAKSGKFTNHGEPYPFDIGNSCRKGIIELQTGKRNKDADLSSSNGNGGLMRIPPLALLYVINDKETIKYVINDKDLMKYIQLFNRCSHNHKISNVGCLIYIRLAEQLIKGLNIRDALSAAVNAIDSQYKIPEYQRIWDLSILNTKENDISSSGYVVDTLEAAIWCCHNASSYKEAVLSAVNLGNDTDTIAALTGFLAGICYKGIPAEWKSSIRDKETIERLCQNFQSTLVHDS
jgi:ADP-ribosylglycohydrolase